MQDELDTRQKECGRERFWSASRGQVIVIFAAGITLLFAIVALSIDGGFIMSERRQVQSAADAGALAAAQAKLDYLNSGSFTQMQINAGEQYGSRNADVPVANVDVDPDPSEYPYMDGEDFNRYVTVQVRKPVTPFFLRAVYDGEWSVSAEAVASIRPIQIPYALLALCGDGVTQGIHVNGSATITVHEGSIMSNCNITSSGAASGSEVFAAVTIDANGYIEAGSNWCGGDDCTSINENRPQITDPVVEAGVEPPDRAVSQALRMVIDDASMRAAVTNLGTQTNPYRCPESTTCVMQPGYYGGAISGISVRGRLEMQPGVYYFGDNFVIDGHSANTVINGNSVLLYFDDNARFDPKHARIQLSAAGALEASCESELASIVLWIANGTPFLMQSNGKFLINGVIYAPDSHVRLFGGPYSSGMQVIVKSLELSGGNDFDILYLDCFDGSTPRVFLVQ